MADNYLEKKFEDMRSRQSAAAAKEERLRQRAWKKRMDAYRRRLELEQSLAENDPQREDRKG
jgi:hypothetical protein